jgi:hypothetical protein
MTEYDDQLLDSLSDTDLEQQDTFFIKNEELSEHEKPSEHEELSKHEDQDLFVENEEIFYLPLPPKESFPTLKALQASIH